LFGNATTSKKGVGLVLYDSKSKQTIFKDMRTGDEDFLKPHFFKTSAQTDPIIILCTTGADYTYGVYIYTLTKSEMKLLEIGESKPNPEVFSLFNKFVSKIGLPDHMIDISNTFNNIDEEVFQDDGHLNQIGNYHVAMKIVQEILKKWPIPAN
jgi:hypothetical protein